MKNKLIDHIRRLLLRQKLELDHNEMLQSIFDELPEKEKKRRIVPILLLGLFIFGTIIFGNHIESSVNSDISGLKNINPDYLSEKGIDEALMTDEDNTAQIKDRIVKNTSIDLVQELEVPTTGQLNLSDFDRIIENRFTSDERVLFQLSNPTRESERIEENIDRENFHIEDAGNSKAENAFLRFTPISQSVLREIILPRRTHTLPLMDINQSDSEGRKRRVEISFNSLIWNNSTSVPHQSSRISAGAQILLKYNLGQLNLLTGVQYRLQNSILNFTKVDIERLQNIGQAENLCPMNATECLRYNLLQRTTRRIHHNRIRTLGLPLGIEYETNGTYPFWFRTGVVLSLSSSYKYEFINDEQNVTNIMDHSDVKIKESINYFLGGGIKKKVSDRCNLAIGIIYQDSFHGRIVSPFNLELPSMSLAGSFEIAYKF